MTDIELNTNKNLRPEQRAKTIDELFKNVFPVSRSGNGFTREPKPTDLSPVKPVRRQTI